MTLTLNGTIPVYHYSKKDLGEETTLDPSESVKYRSFYSQKEYKRSSFPRVFYYTDLKKVEPNVKSPNLYVGKVSGNKILQLKEAIQSFRQDEELMKKQNPKAYEVALALKGEGYWTDFDSMFKVASKYFDGVFYDTGNLPMINLFKPLKVKKYG